MGRPPKTPDGQIEKLNAKLDDAFEQIKELQEDIRRHRSNEQSFAREKARRTDQFRALLKATSLVLAVAAGEIIDLNEPTPGER